MTPDQWMSRAYQWGCGYALGVPIAFGLVIWTFVPHGMISTLAFVLLLFGAAAWASGCFLYGLHCIECFYAMHCDACAKRIKGKRRSGGTP